MAHENVTLSGERVVRVYGGSPWPIQKYIIEWEGENPRPRPPREKVKTADGTEETYVLRRDPEYLNELEKWRRQREITEDIPLLVNALKDEHADEDTLWRGEWVKAHERTGLILPEDPVRRQYEYLRTEVLRTDIDLALVGTMARIQTFPQEEAIKARMRGFTSPSTSGLLSRMRESLAGLLSKARGTSTPG